jgi:cell division septum initiation protein DivIVA
MQNAINELENLVKGATRLPVGGKLLLEEAALRRVIEDLRRAMPDAERLWQQIVAERDRVLGEADAQALRIKDEAQFGDLESDAAVQAARQRAREIQAEAERAALKLREEADHYVLNQFGALEQRLMRVLREVQAGQRSLRGDEG